MPGPKTMTKRTGDIHPPLEGNDTGYEDVAMEVRADADLAGASGEGASFQTSSTEPNLALGGHFGDFRDFGGSLRGYADVARERVRAKPYKALGSAFVLGFVLARLFR